MMYINEKTGDLFSYKPKGMVVKEYVKPEPAEKVNSDNQDNYEWAKSEILAIPEQIRNCELKESYPDDARVKCISTKADWEEYLIALKYYATVDEDGNYSTRVDDRPTRPS